MRTLILSSGAGLMRRDRLDVADCLGQPISDLLHPVDSGVFAAATRQLLEDETHTVEVVFRIRDYRDDVGVLPPVPAYRPMEGKGMLMRERATGEPSHSMWVLKPCDTTDATLRPTTAIGEAALHGPPILCRICDCSVPAAFFEEHAEICLVTHRLQEMADADDHELSELANAMRDLVEALAGDGQDLQYRGVTLLHAPSPSAAQGRRPVSPQPDPVRRLQRCFLADLLDVVEAAVAISGNVQELSASRLSPTSEVNLERLRVWVCPSVEDPALALLAQDVEQLVRRKYASATRLHNATLYANQVSIDWQSTAPDRGPNDEDLASGDGDASEALAGLGLRDATQSALTVDAIHGPSIATSKPDATGAEEAMAGLTLAEPFAQPAGRRRSTPAHTASSSPVLSATPLSPRLGSSTQRPKTQITIKAFDIVKPISKGAFGRCAQPSARCGITR